LPIDGVRQAVHERPDERQGKREGSKNGGGHAVGCCRPQYPVSPDLSGARPTPRAVSPACQEWRRRGP
jgi:hypothetical protein